MWILAMSCVCSGGEGDLWDQATLVTMSIDFLHQDITAEHAQTVDPWILSVAKHIFSGSSPLVTNW